MRVPRRGVLGGCLALAGCASSASGPESVQTRRDLSYGPGPRNRLDLTLPGGAARATVVFLYGGAWDSGSRGTYGFVGSALAGLGCAVVIPDYRLWPDVRWPAFIEDGAAAVAWAAGSAGRAAGVPAGPLFLMGHSAGAFNAIALGTDPRWLGEAGRRGLAGTIALSGPYDFAPRDQPLPAIFADAPGGRARADPTEAAVARGAARVLLLHGEADGTVEPDQTRRLAARLGAAAVSVTTRFYPGVGHLGIITTLNRTLRGVGLAPVIPVLEDVAGFIAAG